MQREPSTLGHTAKGRRPSTYGRNDRIIDEYAVCTSAVDELAVALCAVDVKVTSRHALPMDQRFDKEYARRLLAWNVSRKRATLGLSQEALGTKSGLHRTYVSRIERLEMSATIDSVYALAVGLGTSVSLLFSEEGFIDSPRDA